MNCEGFKDRIFEYLDRSLAAGEMAAAREHLRACGECQSALRHEQAIAQNICHSLHHATEGLSLRSDTLRNVRTAWENESRSTPANVLLWLYRGIISGPIRAFGAAAAILAGVFWLANYQPAEHSSSQAVAEVSHDTWVLDVPIQTRTRLFHRQNDLVVDAIVPSVAVGHARFREK